jgi:hypothetical protein
VDPQQVERVTARGGAERGAEREAPAAALQALPLVEKCRAPPRPAAPDLAVVLAAGGRLPILDRSPPAAPSPAAPLPAAPPPAESEAAAATPDPGWDEEPPPAAGPWREDKVALLLTMQSAGADAAPCPDIPAGFLDVVRIPKLARQLKKNGRATEDAVADSDEPEATAAVLREQASEPPEVLTRQVKGSEKFWSEAGSAAVLQLRADQLRDGEPRVAFWQRRQAAATGQRRYRRTG